MNSRHTAMLVILVALAAAGFWLVESRPWEPPPTPLMRFDPLRMFTVLLPEVQEIAIENHSTGERAKLTRGEGQSWWLIEPEHKQLDVDKMVSMGMTLTSLSAERVLTDTAVLDSFGLGRPTLTLSFSGRSENQTLAVGASTPIGGSYYALRRETGQVFLVPAKTVDDLVQLIAWLPNAVPPPSPIEKAPSDFSEWVEPSQEAEGRGQK